MEFVNSDKIIADCCRTRSETNYHTELHKKETDNQLSKNLKNLKFYREELITHKDYLMCEMNHLIPFESKISQTKNSLNYPKQITLKCLDIREDRIGEDLCKDDVEIELKKEIDLLEDTEQFFENLQEDIKEQLREYRSIMYYLEQDLQKKETALFIEKKNYGIKITDLCLPVDFNAPIVQSKNNSNVGFESEWENNTQKLMNQSKMSIQEGRKLRFRTDELLTIKTDDLIEQYNKCNRIFQNRITYYKDMKNNLEKKLSKINEKIFQMKQNMKELEDAITEKKPYMNVAQIRLVNRTNASQSELLRDNVTNQLMKEINELRKVTDNLMTKYSMSQTILASLNKTKENLEHEIRIKTNSVKIDEVQCLTLRSSIHFHVY